MINIKQINIALKVAGEEYVRVHPNVRKLDDIHKILEFNKEMFQEILESSEHYFTHNISDPQILDESLRLLRSNMKIDEHHCKQDSVNKYMKIFDHVN